MVQAIPPRLMKTQSFLPRTGVRLVLAATTSLFLLGSPPARAADKVEEFETELTLDVEPNSHEETKIAIVEDPSAPGNHVLKLSWVGHRGSHVAGNIKGNNVKLIEEPGSYKVTARVNFEECETDVQSLSLRVFDSQHETFQFTVPVEHAGEPGWHEIAWIISTDSPDTGGVVSWGEHVNKVCDLPLRFLGFAAAFKGHETKGGAILFDDIAIERINP